MNVAARLSHLTPKQRDVLVCIGLFVLTLLLRVPFHSHVLYHWDSVNFALALGKFDVRLHQPHPPGTFVIYIMLGRLINLFLDDPNASLVWLSILSSGLAVVAAFILGKRWFDRGVGLTVALLVLSSPLVWFNGEVALSYALEFFWVLLLVLTCTGLRTGSQSTLFISALLMGLAGGIRPNTPVFLFPLWAVSVRKFPIRRIIVALLLMAMGVALWAIPMIWMSGGPGAYWETFKWWRSAHTEESGSLQGMLLNGGRFGMFTLYGVGAGFVPVIWALYRYRRDLMRLLLSDWRVQMLALWIVPGTAYFVFVHIKQAGHTFTIMPAYIIVVGRAITALRRNKAGNSQKLWVAIVATVVVCNSLFFLIGPPNLFGSSRTVFSTPTWAAIREYDADISQRLETIRGTFRPGETVVIAGSRNFRIPDFYLRDFQLTSLSSDLGEDIAVLPEHVRTLVLFDDAVLPELSAESHLQSLPLPGDKSLRYVTWGQSQKVGLSQTTLEIQER